MNIIQWIFKRVFTPWELQPKDLQQNPIVIPKPGERWTLRTGDPFPPKYPPAVIREVKNGWVRYDAGGFDRDERKPISSFVHIYEKLELEDL